MSKVKELKATYLNSGIVFQDFFNYNSLESSMHFLLQGILGCHKFAS